MAQQSAGHGTRGRNRARRAGACRIRCCGSGDLPTFGDRIRPAHYGAETGSSLDALTVILDAREKQKENSNGGGVCTPWRTGTITPVVWKVLVMFRIGQVEGVTKRMVSFGSSRAARGLITILLTTALSSALHAQLTMTFDSLPIGGTYSNYTEQGMS